MKLEFIVSHTPFFFHKHLLGPKLVLWHHSSQPNAWHPGIFKCDRIHLEHQGPCSNTLQKRFGQKVILSPLQKQLPPVCSEEDFFWAFVFWHICAYVSHLRGEGNNISRLGEGEQKGNVH